MEQNHHDQFEAKLTPFRKGATKKTEKINECIKKNIFWERLKVEQEWATRNVLKNVLLPVIKPDDSLLPVWDLKRYDFLLNDKLPSSVNPKLWYQGKLNLNAGLFQVTENIYQVRGFDLANLSIIRGKTGWIVIDCLTSRETAEAAFELIDSYFGKVPVSAIIFSHSHVDHYGGVDGVLNSGTTDDVKIYAPSGFLSAALEENVTAGVAMSRRGFYMYGEILPRGEKGQIDSGIGKYVSTGVVTLVNSAEEISPLANESFVEKMIDGVKFQFQITPDTEAPAEMNMFVPEEKSLCIAENCTASLHNIYTLRGAEVRDPVAWAKYIQQAIDLFGEQLTSVFEVHNWPRHGRVYCIDYMEKQRDMYQYINDQTLRLINQGYTMDEVGRMVAFPKSLQEEWFNSSFYGTVNHNSKAVYQKYIGWYNGNPVDLNKLLPEDSSKKYVEFMGGEDEVIKKAKKSFREGEYQWVAEVTKHVIFANPSNKKARYLCADALEQLGYIAESGPWRNEYLMGAQELRYGIIPIQQSTITAEVLDVMTLEQVLNMLSIRINGLIAGDYDFKLNFIIPDRKEQALTEVKRGIFRYLSDEIKEDQVKVIMNKKTLYELATTNNRSSPFFYKSDRRYSKVASIPMGS
ncbi:MULTISPECIES: alkyl/aryl-sulfatase [Pontibacillus]|uniref:Alkyl sulfatase dimerization domain-containing protein n=1 Tax=Pontibacillus chungwhensis TaxID=265426 RepID=A0ABY8USR9_9BACI|nr:MULTISPECIES: alkyl sulfatase dimerization domain-containing protein [Pontibacillus]MCD5323339.1 MBL fold metallo-hydrolase [Pontibacillus sp. HN14]WIF96720.1 alkyl sulfatase dimerization domain-containing protein [Pontibacillus chungwhensis]